MENYKQILENSNNTEEIIEVVNHLIMTEKLEDNFIPIFTKYLSNDDRAIRDAGYRALINYPEPLKCNVARSVSPIIETRKIEIRNLAGDILLKLGVNTSEPLVKYLKSDDFDIRKFACDIIGLVDTGKYLDTVMQLYDDNDTNVVLSSIEAVGNIFYRNQTNVDKTHIIYSLIELYETNNDVLKPQIVDTLGKIGGKEAEEFLLNILRYDNDYFLKIASIDSLAIVGSNIEISNLLLSEINTYPIDIQTVVLKTALAIGVRLGELPELPSESRKIAHKALKDLDKDISSAGLVALGETYELEDIDSLVNFFERADYDTQQYILYNLVENSYPKVLEIFFDKIFDIHINENNSSNNIELLLVIHPVWNNFVPDKQKMILTTLLNVVLNRNTIDNTDLIEFIAKFEATQLEEVKEEMKLADTSIIKPIDELFQKIYNFQ